jgi:hypothetical protein
MILMALDHTRDFFGVIAIPPPISRARPRRFLHALITHICGLVLPVDRSAASPSSSTSTITSTGR